MNEPEVLCGDTFFSCVCELEPKHQGSHVCDCEGSWNADGNIVEFPGVVVDDRYLPMGTRLPPVPEWMR